MQTWILAFLAFAWAPCAPASADADAGCRCLPFTLEEAADRADAVFVATVDSLGTGTDENGAREVWLRVEDAWKGVDTQEVRVSGNATSCGIRFTPGERYLVFAEADSAGTFRTAMCMGTRGLDPDAPLPSGLGVPARLRAAGLREEGCEELLFVPQQPGPRIGSLALVDDVVGAADQPQHLPPRRACSYAWLRKCSRM
jgi:hypothetical protein